MSSIKDSIKKVCFILGSLPVSGMVLDRKEKKLIQNIYSHIKKQFFGVKEKKINPI